MAISNSGLYIHGWKNIAQTIGVSERTLKRWHYSKLRLSLKHWGSHGRNPSRICISRYTLMVWLEHLTKKAKPKGDFLGSNKLTRKWHEHDTPYHREDS